jgi:hypothetical protein
MPLFETDELEVIDMGDSMYAHTSEHEHEHNHEQKDEDEQIFVQELNNDMPTLDNQGISVIEVSPEEQGEIVITVGELPGAPEGTVHPEIIVEDQESDGSDSDLEDNDEDNNDARKKKDKWDWASKGATGFIAWIKDRISSIPKHSGYDSAGLERAVAYLDKLDSEISKAMRLDLDGDLDANKIEEVRSEIDEGISRLNIRLDKVNKKKKSTRKGKKASEDFVFIKEAQKITGVQGIYVTVPLLISRIARVCINGMVSAGHDIEDIYSKQVEKYKLSPRERAETMQLLSDMGYPLRQDRGYLEDEDVDFSSSDNMDMAANYRG